MATITEKKRNGKVVAFKFFHCVGRDEKVKQHFRTTTWKPPENLSYCKVCGDEVSREAKTIQVLGHTEETVPGKAASCTETGLTDGVICSVCDETLVKQEVIPALGHTEDEPVEENKVEPDCDTEGSYDSVIYCKVCGDEVRREAKTIPALGHTEDEPVEENRVEPDCDTEGSYDSVIYCKVCGDEVRREAKTIQVLGHTEETVPGKAASCTETGLTDGVKCSVCGETLVKQEVILALGHTEETVPGKAATCTESGLTDGVKCKVCGEILTKQQVIPAKGHVPGEPVVENDVPADCENAGSHDLVIYCGVCGKEISREKVTVPAKGHGKEVVPGKAATCTETGLTDGEKCPASGEILTKQQEIPALGHTEEILPGKDAGCTETGLTSGAKCSVCGEVLVEQEEIPALGHTPEADDGDCTTAVNCSVCGSEAIPAQEDHSYGDDHLCANCGKEALVYVAFHSLSLKGDIGVNYYLHIDESIVKDESGFMRFITPRGGTVDIPISKADVRTVGNEVYYGFTATVAAKEMTDVVIGQYFYTDGSSAAKEYSVKAYADVILTNAGQSDAFEKAQPMVSAMLDYGAYAQKHFAYNTGKPACDPADVSHVTAQTLSAFKRSGEQGTALVPFGGSSLILKTETTMRLFFLPDASVSGMTAACGGDQLIVNAAKGYSYVNIANISAKDLDADYIVTIDDGVETANVTYNPMAYCYNILNAAEGTYSTELQNTVRALYLYNQAANEYFN